MERDVLKRSGPLGQGGNAMSVRAHRGPKDRPRCASRGVVPGPRGGPVDVLQVAQPAPDAGEAAQS